MRSMTLYPSELMTVSTGMYTKHYYNGSARIASRIGGGFVPHRDLNDYFPLPLPTGFLCCRAAVMTTKPKTYATSGHVRVNAWA